MIVPGQPVELDGKKHFGWWRIDPSSGDAVGVMESGYHQATIERGELEEGPIGRPKCNEFFLCD